jgi:hypothetical protein
VYLRILLGFSSVHFYLIRFKPSENGWTIKMYVLKYVTSNQIVIL